MNNHWTGRDPILWNNNSQYILNIIIIIFVCILLVYYVLTTYVYKYKSGGELNQRFNKL